MSLQREARARRRDRLIVGFYIAASAVMIGLALAMLTAKGVL